MASITCFTVPGGVAHFITQNKYRTWCWHCQAGFVLHLGGHSQVAHFHTLHVNESCPALLDLPF